jgi:rod shape determining protein RodA
MRRACWPVLPVVALILGFGLLLQWSVAGAGAFPFGHAARGVAALTAAVFAVLWGLRRWRDQAALFYGFCIALLVLVLLTGREVNAARRWIHLPGGFTLQPSEFLKVALIVLLARWFAEHPRPSRLADLIRPGLITLVPFGLILIEPDLGTALSTIPLFYAMAWIAGAPRRTMLALVLTPLLLAPGAWFLIQDYQKERVMTWWNQEQLTSQQKAAEGYHLWHSKIAIGSGGVEGHGWGRGPENRLDRLPERHNDFVFPVLAEEGGLGASLLFLAAYSSLGFVLLGYAARRRDLHTRLLLAGVGCYFLVHLIINVGVTSGVWPTTGLPIPLVSHGGSAMLSCGLALGIAWAAARARTAELSDRAFEDG